MEPTDDLHSPAYEIEIAQHQPQPEIPEAELRHAVECVLLGEQVASAQISVALVDDDEIHKLNRRFLQHDYPTDVLSFLLSEPEQALEGELVVSVDTAARNAEQFGWPTTHEVRLCLIHGTLHLLGYDDATPTQQQHMRRKENLYLAQLGLQRGDQTEGPRL